MMEQCTWETEQISNLKKKLKLNSATDNKAKRTFTNDCVVEFVCEKVVQFGGAINGESHSDINVMRR